MGRGKQADAADGRACYAGSADLHDGGGEQRIVAGWASAPGEGRAPSATLHVDGRFRAAGPVDAGGCGSKGGGGAKTGVWQPKVGRDAAPALALGEGLLLRHAPSIGPANQHL